MSIRKKIFASPDRVRARDAQSGARSVAVVWGRSITRGERLPNGEFVVIERCHAFFESVRSVRCPPAGMFSEERYFEFGERVRIWDERARAWKVTTVRAMIWTPYQGSKNPAFYQVDDGCGKLDPREYRGEELHPLADEPRSLVGVDDLPALPHA